MSLEKLIAQLHAVPPGKDSRKKRLRLAQEVGQVDDPRAVKALLDLLVHSKWSFEKNEILAALKTSPSSEVISLLSKKMQEWEENDGQHAIGFSILAERDHPHGLPMLLMWAKHSAPDGGSPIPWVHRSACKALAAFDDDAAWELIKQHLLAEVSASSGSFSTPLREFIRSVMFGGRPARAFALFEPLAREATTRIATHLFFQASESHKRETSLDPRWFALAEDLYRNHPNSEAGRYYAVRVMANANPEDKQTRLVLLGKERELPSILLELLVPDEDAIALWRSGLASERAFVVAASAKGLLRAADPNFPHAAELRSEATNALVSASKPVTNASSVERLAEVAELLGTEGYEDWVVGVARTWLAWKTEQSEEALNRRKIVDFCLQKVGPLPLERTLGAHGLEVEETETGVWRIVWESALHKPSEGDEYPFLFYFESPNDWYDGVGGYELCFLREPTPEERRAIVEVVDFETLGTVWGWNRPWLWSGRFALTNYEPDPPNYPDAFFEAMREAMREVDKIIPLAEVQFLGAREGDWGSWHRWSCTQQAVPGPAPKWPNFAINSGFVGTQHRFSADVVVDEDVEALRNKRSQDRANARRQKKQDTLADGRANGRIVIEGLIGAPRKTFKRDTIEWPASLDGIWKGGDWCYPGKNGQTLYLQMKTNARFLIHASDDRGTDPIEPPLYVGYSRYGLDPEHQFVLVVVDDELIEVDLVNRNRRTIELPSPCSQAVVSDGGLATIDSQTNSLDFWDFVPGATPVHRTRLALHASILMDYLDGRILAATNRSLTTSWFFAWTPKGPRYLGGARVGFDDAFDHEGRHFGQYTREPFRSGWELHQLDQAWAEACELETNLEAFDWAQETVAPTVEIPFTSQRYP